MSNSTHPNVLGPNLLATLELCVETGEATSKALSEVVGIDRESASTHLARYRRSGYIVLLRGKGGPSDPQVWGITEAGRTRYTAALARYEVKTARELKHPAGVDFGPLVRAWGWWPA